jgi:hypothetical protein
MKLIRKQNRPFVFQMLKQLGRTVWHRSAEIMNNQKQYLHNVVAQTLEREVQEIRIPVPWGHIAGDLHIYIYISVIKIVFILYNQTSAGS